LRLGQVNTALTHYTKLAQHDDVWGLVASAHVAEMHEQTVVAQAQYERALSQAHSFPRVMQIRDNLRSLNMADAAVRAYERAAILKPRSIEPLLAAGEICAQTDPREAQVWFERAQRVAPWRAEPDFSLGQLMLKAGKLAEAEHLFQAALAKHPHVREYLDSLAMVRKRQQ